MLGNTAEASVWASGAVSPTSVTSFQYDTKKRVIRQAVTEAGKENIVQYSYDPFGRVISEVHSKNGRVSRDIATDYDEFGRATRVEDHETGVVSRYTYAGGGKKRSTSNLTYGSTSVTATVDAIGRETTQAATIALPERTVDVEREVSWNLTKNLPLSATVRIDGVAKTMAATFDDTDRLMNVTGGLWGTGGLSMTYDRGDGTGTGKGTGAKLTDSVSIPWAGGYSTTSRTFGFTPSGRLATVTVGGTREINYSWDASGTGDLLKVKDGAATTTFDNKNGHVLTATSGSSVTAFDYDATGRRYRETAGTTVEDYTWVGDDSLASWKRTVSGSMSASATYSYDGDGQRMRADVYGASPVSTTPTDTAYTYGWDGLTLRWLKGQSAGASSTIEYLSYGDGRAYAASYVATRGAETTSAIFQMLSSDHGDIVALADETGEVFAAYAYGPYGEAEGVTTRQTGSVSATLAAEIAKAQPLRYAGYCYDEWSQDYYLQARYYDASTKQFISKDPAEADGEESAYQYCAGDPIHKVDPTGLWGIGALGRAFKAVKRSVVKTVRRAATVVRSTARKVTRRAVAVVKNAKTRIVQKARAASSWAGAQANRAKNRIAGIRAAAEKRAAAAKRALTKKRAAAVKKGKTAAKRAAKDRKSASKAGTNESGFPTFSAEEQKWVGIGGLIGQGVVTTMSITAAAALATPTWGVGSVVALQVGDVVNAELSTMQLGYDTAAKIEGKKSDAAYGASVVVTALSVAAIFNAPSGGGEQLLQNAAGKFIVSGIYGSAALAVP